MYKSITPLISATSATLITAFQWWRDILREASIQGSHSLIVVKGLKAGIILFIASEVIFFFSFFWAFFHRATCPTPDIGAYWPPIGINPFNPLGIPLLNTLLLVSSGITITWSHHSLIIKIQIQSKKALLTTILLGLYFTALQSIEYWQAEFNIRDSVYGATFFIATGFHGLHVIVGRIFLAINIIQINKITIRHNHYVGFEAAAWYWHFVDVVWLFLYTTIYWWGIYSFSINSTPNFHLGSLKSK